MRKHRICYAVILSVILVICLLSEQWESLLLLLGILILPLAFACLQLLAMRHFHVEIQMQENCRINQQVPLNLKIYRTGKLPLGAIYVTLRMKNHMYGEEERKQLLLQSAEERTMEFEIPLALKDCGNYQITMEEVKCLDLIGLSAKKIRMKQTLEVLAHPVEIQVAARFYGNPEAVSEGESYNSYRRGQDVNEVSGLREYIAGDSLGSIHWKLSGKMDELIVREFGYPSSYSTMILYDLKKFSGDTRIPNVVNNVVISLTLALSYQLLGASMGHNVGWIQEAQLRTLPIYSRTTHDQMTLKLLYGKLEDGKNTVDAMYYFQRSAIKNNFTKLIYITSEYEEHMARQVSGNLDLTIIQVSSEKEMTYQNAGEYTLISVRADDYGNGVLNIEL